MLCLNITTEPLDWERAESILEMLEQMLGLPRDEQVKALAATLAVIRGGFQTIETEEKGE